MSEDKRVTGNLPSFHFCFSYVGSGRDFIQGGWHTWIWRDALCEARRGCKGGFIKWFYFLAVVKGVFDITYLIKKTPLRKFRYNRTSRGWHLGESKGCIPEK